MFRRLREEWDAAGDVAKRLSAHLDWLEGKEVRDNNARLARYERYMRERGLPYTPIKAPARHPAAEEA